VKIFNKIGIITAIVFGIILLFLSAKDNDTYAIDVKKSTENISYKSDQVNPSDLNEWILEKNQTYTLIDIRAEKEFEEGSIPSAENIPLKELLRKETVSDLPKDRPVILYSNGNVENSNAYQIWLILKGAGINAFVLEGGYNYWMKFPILPKNGITNDEILTYKKDLAAANSLKGINSIDISGTDIKPVKRKVSSKRKKKKKKKKH